jgi:predicted metallo-beta-lactamase superfamily hydrolase
MHLNEIEIIPIAAESLGVRSLCTMVRTPDISILLDPSAALAKRYGLEPHPLEYQALRTALDEIHTYAKEASILSISHYHYDHIRPGFHNSLYNLSTSDERKELVTGKIIYAKDNRENINSSQRRRAYYFLKDIKPLAEEIQWVDGRSFNFGDTTITYSHPLPHGPNGSKLGFVLSTIIEHSGTRFLFAPDIQGPISTESLSYILKIEPELAIIGGPPLYLSQVSREEIQSAMFCLSNLAVSIPTLVVDHHNMRGGNWSEWVKPVLNVSMESGNSLLTMAELAGNEEQCLESDRKQLYHDHPPSDEFLNWTHASEEYKVQNTPPF